MGRPMTSIPGADLDPMGPFLDPSRPVYRPVPQDGLMKDEERDKLIRRFAGGLLGGFQESAPSDPKAYGMQWQRGLLGGRTAVGSGGATAAGAASVNPSGVYSATPNGEGPENPDERSGSPALTNLDYLRLMFSDVMGKDSTALGGTQAARAQIANQYFGPELSAPRYPGAPGGAKLFDFEYDAPADPKALQGFLDWMAPNYRGGDGN